MSIVATINVLPCAVTRMAPCVVIFSAINSIAGTGRLDQCQFSWNFSGQPVSDELWSDPRFNNVSLSTLTDQRGFTAGCICRNSGTLTATLTITNIAGESDSDSVTVDIFEDSRTYKYLDVNAVSNGDGSIETPYNVYSSGIAFLNGGNSRGLFFKRDTTIINSGTTILTPTAPASQIYIGAYGTGNKPIINDIRTTLSSCWIFQNDAEGVFVEDIKISGASDIIGGGTPLPGYANAITINSDNQFKHMALLNIDIEGCRYGITHNKYNDESPSSMLYLNINISNHGSYGIAGNLRQAVFLGCSITNSGVQHDEHCLRTGCDQITIDGLRSDFPANLSNKDALRCELFTTATLPYSTGLYVGRSYLTGGATELGWSNSSGNIALSHILFENNRVSAGNLTGSINTAMNVGVKTATGISDVTNVTIRNNVYYSTGVYVTSSALSLGDITNTSVVDNTFIWPSYTIYGDRCSGILIQRNLFNLVNNSRIIFMLRGTEVFESTDNVCNHNTNPAIYYGGDLTWTEYLNLPNVGTDYLEAGLDLNSFDTSTFIFSTGFTTVYGNYTNPIGASVYDYNNHPRYGVAGAAENYISSLSSYLVIGNLYFRFT